METEMSPRSVGTLRAFEPSLQTLFISRFFLLASQVAELYSTEGYLARLVCSGGGGGHSRPAGAGLTAAFSFRWT